MLSKKFLLKAVMLFSIAGAVAFGSGTFAHKKNSYVGDPLLLKIDESISKLKEEQNKGLTSGVDCGRLIRYLENIKQMESLKRDGAKLLKKLKKKRKKLKEISGDLEQKRNELTEEEKKRVDHMQLGDFDSNNTALTPFSSRGFGMFDFFNKSINEDFNKSIKQMHKELKNMVNMNMKEFMPRLTSNLGVSSLNLPSEVLEEVSKLENFVDPGILIFDGNGNLKLKLISKKINLEKFKEDFNSNITLFEAVKNLLIRADVPAERLDKEDEKQDFSIFITQGKKNNSRELMCFSQRVDKNGCSKTCADYSVYSDFFNDLAWF